MRPEYGSGVIAFRNLDDPSKYLSSEFAAILVDELTKNLREVFDFLILRMRWPGIPDVRFVGATNPGEVGHGWVKKLWIDRDFSGESFNQDEFFFVKSLFSDNRFIDPGYGKQLDALPETMRRAYKDGDWDLFVGQFFTEFRRERHVIAPFDIPKSWTKIRCLDYGFKAPACCLWIAIDFDGNAYVYRELYESGHNYSDLARVIGQMTPSGENIDYTAADTEMFAKTRDTGEYGHDIMADSGIPITPANKERIPGWNLIRKKLKDGQLKFFSTCVNTIRTIPSLVYDSRKVEDLDSTGEDHCADALRYGLMSLPNKPSEDSTLKAPEGYVNDPSAPWNQNKGEANYKNFYGYK